MIITIPFAHRRKIMTLGIRCGADPEPGIEPASFNLDLAGLHSYQVDSLYEYLKMYPEARQLRVNINAFKRARDAGGEAAVNLKGYVSTIVDWLTEGAIEGWLFEQTDEPSAALVTGVIYYPAVKSRDGYSPPYISVHLMRNVRGKAVTENFHLGENSYKFPVAETFMRKGWMHETEELLESYQTALEHYKSLRPAFGKQLKLTKSHIYNPNRGKYRWDHNYDEDAKESDLSEAGRGRSVHDDPLSEAAFSSEKARWSYKDPDNPMMEGGLAAAVEARFTDKEGRQPFTRAPFVMKVKCFHLDRHVNFEAHASNLELYVYDKTMRSKLVLPAMYNEVLDVLTDDMKLIQEDIVEGKTGGNVVLLAGPPGLGKTLTAEVYAEHREVPLYKVHSGQLGVDAKEVEKNLQTVYERASRWGIPVLLDEFDVFGRARGTDLRQNAVVAVFLRTLEYQNNTIFLTTNRADDMDDAILSRCAAIVKFDFPEYEELKQIWEVQKKQLLPEVQEEDIEKLMAYFVEHKKKMSGRDVKNALQLAARWVASTNRKPDFSLLQTSAGFRGI